MCVCVVIYNIAQFVDIYTLSPSYMQGHSYDTLGGGCNNTEGGITILDLSVHCLSSNIEFSQELTKRLSVFFYIGRAVSVLWGNSWLWAVRKSLSCVCKLPWTNSLTTVLKIPSNIS